MDKMEIFCSNCGKEVPEGVAFCSACGNRQDEQVQQLVQIKKHCSNCGSELEDDEVFCAFCGQRHEWQTEQPYNSQQPTPVKKKSKAPFIIAGAAVLVVALVVAGVFTNGFGLFGSTGGGTVTSGDNSNININVPKNGSDEEKLAYGFIELNAGIYQVGLDFTEVGAGHVADGAFSLSLASVSSMRYAVDCLLEMKGTTPTEDGRIRDWDAIAAMNWASPFPYFFEGVICGAQGDTAQEAECYRKATLNPNFTEDYENLKTIAAFDQSALENLKTVLEEIEDKLIDSYGLWFSDIPRDENNFDVEYLRQKAMECLEAEEEDLLGALSYYQAALQLNPLDGDSYANLVVVFIYIDDGEMTINYLNDGLMVDPENVRLAYLQNMIKEALEK